MESISPFHLSYIYMVSWLFCSLSSATGKVLSLQIRIFKKHLPFSTITVLYFVSFPHWEVGGEWGRFIAGEGTVWQVLTGEVKGATIFSLEVMFFSQCEWSFWQFRLSFLCFMP